MGFMDYLTSNYANNEVATKKKMSLVDVSSDNSQYADNRNLSRTTQTTTTDSRSWSNQSSSNFNPIDNRSLSLVLNSSGANVSTKKNISSSSTPSFSNTPTTSVIPSLDLKQTSKNLQSLTSSNLGKYLMYAGLAVGGYWILKKTPMGKKVLGGKK